MKKKSHVKPIGNAKREILLFAERILVVIAVLCLSFVFMNSFLNMQTSYGAFYHSQVSVLERNEAYEDQEVFRDLMLGNMQQIVDFVTIRHQLETDGAYDTDKMINISEYAIKAGAASGEGATAVYSLDDLVKWGNYGFSYKTVVGTWEELNLLFKGNSATYVNEDGSFMEIKNAETQIREDAGSLGLAPSEKDKYAMEILVDRYKTVNGKSLMECASNVEEYEYLKDNLEYAAVSLFENYTEYMRLTEVYDSANTNIGYCLRIPSDDRMIYYTNSDINFRNKSVDEITSTVKGLGGKFLYFNPDKVQLSTNTEFQSSQLRAMLKEHGTTFRDDSRVWFWVDTAYPAADDLYVGREMVWQIMPYYWQLLGGAGVALLLAVWILCYLTPKEGYIQSEDRILPRTKRSDRFPLELWVILAGIPEVFLGMLTLQLIRAYSNGSIGYAWLPVAFGGIVFVANELFVRGYFSVIRRIHSKILWRTTFACFLLDRIRRFCVNTYRNGGLVSRTWIPYLIFLMVNLILVLLGLGGIIGAFLLDILVGVYLYRDRRDRIRIVEGIESIKKGEVHYRIDTERLHGDNLVLAESVNSIGIGIRKAVETSMKDEKMKADLITNVSHDIKTPLTSIITYVDLMKRENIENEKVRNYLEVLDSKSQRLKQLTDDLVEASRISSGNIHLQMEHINFVELLRQALGEFSERFEERKLQIVTRLPENALTVEADSRQLWRVMENLFQNVAKYALEGTRVYVETEEVTEGKARKVVFSAKNISSQPLDLSPEELTERFIRGDQSRRTEGSGLGLSIARNLMEAQGGDLKIALDGDLFKVILELPLAVE
ncbi:MAG: HAMP domain-containing histidine kinase [Lachnospiraceae bacterium]|nr:HAMP domain-containing histidine kinase [Lachnospiraceae bacterium]